MRMNAKKKEKTRRETTAIKVWVTPAEKAAITVKADAYSLSASTYLRELALRSTRPLLDLVKKSITGENEPICNVFVLTC